MQIDQLVLYREIIAVCYEVHTKRINTLCGQNVEFLGRVGKIAESGYYLSRVCPSVSPHGSLWTDIHDVLYLHIIRKSVGKIQVPVKSDTNKSHVT